MWVHVEQVRSSAVGKRIAGVHCDQCGAEYFYELTRVGIGSATAAYGFGKEAAKRKAFARAQKDLGKRLATDAELVPCPKCGWVKEELIAAFRKWRYRGWTNVAIVIAVGGSAIAIALALVLLTDQKPDPTTAARILGAGLSASFGGAIGLIAFCDWMRGRIQPNANHPGPPILPPCTPPALTKDSNNGKLEPAPRRESAGDAVDRWVAYRVGQTLPGVCCRCLNASQTVLPLQLFTDIQLRIPLCAVCLKERNRTIIRYTAAIYLGALAAIAVALWLGGALKDPEWWILVYASVVLPLLAYVVAKRMTKPVGIRIADRSRGVVWLRFRNDDYRKRLIAAGQT